MKLYCDLTNQRFAVSMRDRSEPRHLLTGGTSEPVELYLVRPTNHLRYPFMFDPESGNADLESPVVTLFNPFGPVTLTAPVLLTPIRNGFSGIIELATAEVQSFLLNLCERAAILSIDAVKDTLPRSLFQAPLFLRQPATSGTPSSGYELSGAFDPATIAAAGLTDLAPVADFIQWFQLFNVTPGGAAFTHQVTLDSARALRGARLTVQVVIPASAHPPALQIFDNSVSSTLLDTIAGDTDNDVNYRFEAILVGTSWKKENAEYLT